jgi:hypothetical protein
MPWLHVSEGSFIKGVKKAKHSLGSLERGLAWARVGIDEHRVSSVSSCFQFAEFPFEQAEGPTRNYSLCHTIKRCTTPTLSAFVLKQIRAVPGPDLVYFKGMFTSVAALPKLQSRGTD